MPPEPKVIVAAQWDDNFMAEAARWQGGPCGAACFDGADSDRATLLGALQPGDALVYLGHSTPRAWLGFRGIREDHLPKLPAPLACVIALTCHGAAPGSLGSAWAERGLARAVIGPRGPIPTPTLMRIAASLRGLFSGARVPSPAKILACAQQAAPEPGIGLLSAPVAA